jgi:hypothetical protein
LRYLVKRVGKYEENNINNYSSLIGNSIAGSRKRYKDYDSHIKTRRKNKQRKAQIELPAECRRCEYIQSEKVVVEGNQQEKTK